MVVGLSIGPNVGTGIHAGSTPAASKLAMDAWNVSSRKPLNNAQMASRSVSRSGTTALETVPYRGVRAARNPSAFLSYLCDNYKKLIVYNV